jgi:hypothetical protein
MKVEEEFIRKGIQERKKNNRFIYSINPNKKKEKRKQ